MRRVLSGLARLITFFLFSRLEVAGRERLPADRPTLLVANHFNGLVDALVLTRSVPGTPRFLAKDTLTKVPGVGPLLRSCGVIFVQRQIDREGTAGNVSAFAAAHRALLAHDVVAIFPEGTTHDRPQIDPVRTGAARIALGARGAGAAGLVIVPVGLTFNDKVSLRSTALVQFGAPMALDDLVDPGSTDADVEAVQAVTSRIEASLRSVSPDFPDVETWLALTQAAEVGTRTRAVLAPSLAVQADMARRLARAPADAQQALRVAVGRYATVLAGLKIDDRDVVAPANTGEVLRRAVLTGLLVVLLGSLVGATILVNAIPAALVAAVSLVITAPVTKGTARVLVGLIAFPATWITAAALAVDGAWAIAWLVAVFIAGAASALALSDRALALVGALLRWRLSRERIATLHEAEVIRADVVDAVRSALAVVPRAG